MVAMELFTFNSHICTLKLLELGSAKREFNEVNSKTTEMIVSKVANIVSRSAWIIGHLRADNSLCLEYYLFHRLLCSFMKMVQPLLSPLHLKNCVISTSVLFLFCFSFAGEVCL